MRAGRIPGQFVPGVSVTDNPHGGVIVEYPGQFAVRLGCAVGNGNLPRMLRITHAHAPAVVKGNPGSA